MKYKLLLADEQIVHVDEIYVGLNISLLEHEEVFDHFQKEIQISLTVAKEPLLLIFEMCDMYNRKYTDDTEEEYTKDVLALMDINLENMYRELTNFSLENFEKKNRKKLNVFFEVLNTLDFLGNKTISDILLRYMGKFIDFLDVRCGEENMTKILQLFFGVKVPPPQIPS